MAGGRIRAVFLDMGDTLVELAAPLNDVYVRVARESGQTIDTDHLARSLAEVSRETDERNRHLEFEATEEADRFQWRDFNSRLLQRLEIAEHLWGATMDEIEAAFVDPANFRVFPETVEALAALRDAGYRLAMVSNWDWRLPILCDSLGLAPYFDPIVSSARVGSAKPHPGIFRHTLQACGLPPEAVVHVGDNPIADVGGALGVGITPVLLDRHGRNADVEAPHRITALTDLPNLIGEMNAQETINHKGTKSTKDTKR